MRLIDADTFRESWLENGENEYVYNTNSVLESIDEALTVDAVPVVHGEWLPEYVIGYDGIYPAIYAADCSRCGKPTKRGKHFNYCPNCGAKMDGEEDKQK